MMTYYLSRHRFLCRQKFKTQVRQQTNDRYSHLISRFTVSLQKINQVQEGGALQLEVRRAGGTFREVHVTWKITYPRSPQIQKPDQQLAPMNGTLTFKPVSTRCSVTLWLYSAVMCVSLCTLLLSDTWRVYVLFVMCNHVLHTLSAVSLQFHCPGLLLSF